METGGDQASNVDSLSALIIQKSDILEVTEKNDLLIDLITKQSETDQNNNNNNNDNTVANRYLVRKSRDVAGEI
jgi:hypothetical protein